MKTFDKNLSVSGVYAIFFTKDGIGKVYVGSSSNMLRRYKEHLKLLKNNKHHSTHLQNAWNKYGEKYFSFKLIRQVNKEQLLISEQKYMDFFMANNIECGYNICPVAGNSLGRKLSDETKNKIRKKHLGKTLSIEHKEAISLWGLGRKKTEETRKNMSKAQQGYGGGNAKLTEENVIEIKRQIAIGTDRKEIANKYNVAYNTITNIATKHRWKHLN